MPYNVQIQKCKNVLPMPFVDWLKAKLTLSFLFMTMAQVVILNCLSELVEETGGLIDLDKLPVGDPTLSAKEIIGNESQERMGLVIANKHLDTLHKIAERERSPIYDVGDVTGNHRFTFKSSSTKETNQWIWPLRTCLEVHQRP